MSSSLQLPLDSTSSDRVTCPAQLSDESFAKFVIELPLLDESRLSPALVACAAKLRAQFVDALSNAQTVLHAMRDAWIAWHHLPIASPGIVFFVLFCASGCPNFAATRSFAFESQTLTLLVPLCSCGRLTSCFAP